MIVTTKKLFEHAYGKYAIGAYNVNNLEQIDGLFKGNLSSQAPFIIQISKGSRSYTNKLYLEGLIRAADAIYPEAVFAVHLDHGDEATCYDCIESGFYSSVMIDASSKPYEENIAITKRVVDAAHAKGIVVEAEMEPGRGPIATVLVQVDVLDDTDLNLCAGLVEALGEGFWIAPGGQFEPALADWVRYGKVTRIALPTALFERRAVLLGDLLVPVKPMTDMEEA